MVQVPAICGEEDEVPCSFKPPPPPPPPHKKKKKKKKNEYLYHLFSL